MRKLLFSIFTLIISTSVLAGLTPIEQQMSEYILSQKHAQLSLLKELVNINSGTENIKGVHRIGEMLRHEFTQLGFKTYWVEEPANMKRAGTLIAERQGNKGKRLLLIGHLDTVFPANSPFQKFTLIKQSAKGPGTVDDKGGIVVILYALKALKATHALDDTSITVILTGDEENSGKPTSISRQPLFAAAKHSDVALDFETSTNQNTAIIARRGISDWIIETHGNEAHSATIFQNNVGMGAIFALSNILNTLRLQLQHQLYFSFNPGIILGGTAIHYAENSQGTAFGKENVVAKIAMAHGDMRYVSEKQKLAMQAKMVAIVKQHLAGTTSTIEFKDGIPAMPITQKNLLLLKKYSEVSMDLGQGAVQSSPDVRGAGDISHIASIVPANLIGLGARGKGSHSVIESVELDSLAMQTQRAAILIYRLTRVSS